MAAAALLDEHWNLVFADPHLLGRYPPQTAIAMEPYAQAGDMARICQPLDWLGVNHYGPIFARSDPAATWGYGWGSARDDVPSVDIGWTIHPDAFRQTLLAVSRRYGGRRPPRVRTCRRNRWAPSSALPPNRASPRSMVRRARTRLMPRRW